MTPGPSFGAPATPKMGDAPGADPSTAPGPGGAPGAGPDQSQDQAGSGIQAIMGQIRDVGQGVMAIGSAVPSLQPEVAQIQAIIRRMIIKAGQAAPTQTDSASALPM